MKTLTTAPLLRSSAERGRTRLSWLDSYHSFSFGDYYDPQYMGFSDLRVINEDIIAPSGGFGTHGHQNMEIVTVLLSGSLTHQDSMGNGSTIYPGDVQRMSAGSGVLHSEFNASTEESAHLLQIWIEPSQRDITPGYEQQTIPLAQRQGQWRLLASPDGRGGSVTIHQDAELWATLLTAGESVIWQAPLNRRLWLQVATGSVLLDGQVLQAGDAVGLQTTGQRLSLVGEGAESQVMLFNLR